MPASLRQPICPLRPPPSPQDSLLDVLGKAKPPRVVKEIEPKQLTVPGNKELRLNCKISGFPVPQIKWLRDGNEIKVSEGKQEGGWQLKRMSTLVIITSDANIGKLRTSFKFNTNISLL